MVCTLDGTICQVSNILANASEMAAAVCDPLNSCEWSRIFCSLKSVSMHCAVRLSILMRLTSELHMSVVKLIAEISDAISSWT